ncbi:hypothetical protein NQ318_017152 [Aromia moschata]|uniref:Uncharacterized protein n=1 Tax=Aromia moschata TaxID=1265417 RepID=A0AAV8YNZ3_9CUCU|nr:hypothetical protein NQ318_017152 [Aromia moschata]
MTEIGTMTLVQELNKNDPDRQLQFCETMMNLCQTNPNLHQQILFSDEATFCLNGTVNRQTVTERHFSEFLCSKTSKKRSGGKSVPLDINMKGERKEKKIKENKRKEKKRKEKKRKGKDKRYEQK